jgi:hypothetical protein
MSLDKDREELQELGVRYSDSFMKICEDEDPAGDPDRLWKWMAELINDAYQVGWKSTHGKEKV